MQGKKSLISKEQILSAIQDLATDLGRAPTREELEQMGGISPAVVRKHFTRHRSAVRAAGLEPAPTGPGRLIQNQDLLEDWGRVTRELKRMPTQAEYESAGKYSYRCVIDRFQRWRLTPPAFIEAEAKGALRGEWKDVVETIRSAPEQGQVRQARWARKFMAAARKSGRAPSVLMGPLKPAAASTGGNEVRDGDDACGAGGQHGAGRRISKEGAAGPSAAGSADAYGWAGTRAGERDGSEHAVCDDGARPGFHY